MKNIIYILIFSLLMFNVSAQTPPHESSDPSPKKTQNFIGFVPSKKQITNGWAIGWLLMSANGIQPDSVRINGLYTSISPFQIFYAGTGILMYPFYVFSKKPEKELNQTDINPDTVKINDKLNGVAIALFEEAPDFEINGIQITGLIHGMGELNGISVTSIYSDYNVFNGVSISGIYNSADEGNGLQIGLFNKSNEMRGVQIGLWNKIGNKGFPFINFNFRKRGK